MEYSKVSYNGNPFVRPTSTKATLHPADVSQYACLFLLDWLHLS